MMKLLVLCLIFAVAVNAQDTTTTRPEETTTTETTTTETTDRPAEDIQPSYVPGTCVNRCGTAPVNNWNYNYNMGYNYNRGVPAPQQQVWQGQFQGVSQAQVAGRFAGNNAGLMTDFRKAEDDSEGESERRQVTERVSGEALPGNMAYNNWGMNGNFYNPYFNNNYQPQMNPYYQPQMMCNCDEYCAYRGDCCENHEAECEVATHHRNLHERCEAMRGDHHVDIKVDFQNHCGVIETPLPVGFNPSYSALPAPTPKPCACGVEGAFGETSMHINFQECSTCTSVVYEGHTFYFMLHADPAVAGRFDIVNYGDANCFQPTASQTPLYTFRNNAGDMCHADSNTRFQASIHTPVVERPVEPDTRPEETETETTRPEN